MVRPYRPAVFVVRVGVDVRRKPLILQIRKNLLAVKVALFR